MVTQVLLRATAASGQQKYLVRGTSGAVSRQHFVAKNVWHWFQGQVREGVPFSVLTGT